MKKFLIGAAFAAGVLSAATTASAAVLKFNGTDGRGDLSVSGDGPDYSGPGGAFKMEDTGNALGLGDHFIAFCLDLAGTVKTNFNYEINNVNPFQLVRVLSPLQRQNVEDLFDASYAFVDTSDNVQAAAFQLALWEAGYETEEGPLSLTTGTRFGSANAAITAKVNEYLGNMLTWNGANRFNVNFLDADDEARQDLVMATPVPVPAVGLLMLTGVGGIAALRRRKQT